MISARPARSRNLVAGVNGGPYRFVEHDLCPGDRSRLRMHPSDHGTFVVVDGSIRLDCLDADGKVRARQVSRLDGWHALPTSVYRFASPGPARVVEARSKIGEVVDMADEARPSGADPCVGLSDYRVRKPWGYEVWHTHNLAEAAYVVKRIGMIAGHRSSLQSHRHKTETNYIVEGAADVLNGGTAPDGLDTPVNVSDLSLRVHHARDTWSSAPGVIHRVTARTSYVSIEISTPEVDDVIRWADDTERPHGRIGSEHGGG